MSNVDTKLKLWASKKYGIDVTEIESVDPYLTIEYGGGCETCNYEEGILEITTYFKGNTSRVETLSDYDVPTFLQEVLDA